MKKVVPQDAVLIPVQAKRVFEGVIFDAYQWQQQMFDSTAATFEMLKRPDTVQVIGVVDGNLLVLEEEQPHSGRRRSFPGGRVDKTDATLLAAAQRELHEETGYEFKNWRLVSVKQPHFKLEWFIHIFLAWDVLAVGTPHIDAGEKIKVSFLKLPKVKEQSQRGVKYLDEAQVLLEQVGTTEELINMPEFHGQEVER